MRIGFIGAGKVGFTLGKYICTKGGCLAGYYSRTFASAKAAALFTDTTAFENLSDLVKTSDALVVTTPDGEIANVWQELKSCDISGKIVCHCSGSLNSLIFSGAREARAFSYSIHPMYAISSKEDSYKEISNAVFTLEGDQEFLESIQNFIQSMGNTCVIIPSDGKAKYHAAAVAASNLVLGLFAQASEMLVDCGFNEASAREALLPLFLGNANALADKSVSDALTGPVERCDVTTVAKHLSVLDGDALVAYKALSKSLVEVARKKHPDRDYADLLNLLSN